MKTETQGQAASVGSTDWLAASVLPDVLPGAMREFLVTVETRNGRRFVQLAWYANNHWLEWDDSYQGDDADEENGKRWFGWMDVRNDQYGDELYMNVDGRVVAWMEKPAPANTQDEPRA